MWLNIWSKIYQEWVYHGEDFWENDGSFGKVFVQDSNLGLVGCVLNQRGHHC